MIKKYKSVVKAEVFDGSEEMMSRYSIRHYKSLLYASGVGYVLDIPSRYTKGQINPSKLLKGQYIVTTSAGKIINMWPADFEELFLEASND